jgi:hypothetical protein
MSQIHQGGHPNQLPFELFAFTPPLFTAPPRPFAPSAYQRENQPPRY